MNHVQIPEETAKILHKLAVSAAAKVVDHSEAERAIVACGVLTQALGNAKPLPKKPGPKPGKLSLDSELSGIADSVRSNAELLPKKPEPTPRDTLTAISKWNEAEKAEKLMEEMSWKPGELPRHEVGDTFTNLDGVRCEVITVQDNSQGGQSITYKESGDLRKWQCDVLYCLGDRVEFLGDEYEHHISESDFAIVSATANINLPPDKNPILWKRVEK